MSERILCFTGPRRYTGTAEERVRLAEALEAAFAQGYRTFISGMAEGFDMAAAEAVLRLKEHHYDVRLVAAVPFRRQAAGYNPDDKKRYENILSAADEVAVLSENYDYGCYYRRNDWMTSRSSLLVCWYDGGDGGTRHTVKSALRQGLRIVNIYKAPDTLF